MKNGNLFLGMAAMAAMSLSVASCTNEDMQDIQNADGRTPIALVSSVNNSRSANAGLQEAQLAKDMNVGVFVNNGEAGLIENGNNNRLAADGAGALVGGNAMYYPIDGSAVSIYAYAPYSDGWALGENTFTVSADQSTDEGYLASDLLYGTPDNNSITSSANPVSIHFKHKLSKLKLNFDMGETEVNLQGATVSVVNTLPAITLNLQDGTLGTASGAAANIKAAVFGADAAEFQASAVIVPQTIAANTEFVEVTVGTDTYKAELASEVNFEEGKVYTYTVKFDKKGEDVTVALVPATTLDGWGDGDEGSIDAKLAYGVGDYMTSDGKFIKNSEIETHADKDKVVAVIFSTEVCDDDRNDGYNAYAVSMSDFGSKGWIFDDDIEEGCPDFVSALKNLDGRTKTNTILKSNAYAELGDQQGSSFVNYSNYKNSNPVSSSVSSDWFTPSFGQMVQIWNNLGQAGIDEKTVVVEDNNETPMYQSNETEVLANINSYSQKAKGKDIVPDEFSRCYATVTENEPKNKFWCFQTKVTVEGSEYAWSFGKNPGKTSKNRNILPCVAVTLPEEALQEE